MYMYTAYSDVYDLAIFIRPRFILKMNIQNASSQLPRVILYIYIFAEYRGMHDLAVYLYTAKTLILYFVPLHIYSTGGIGQMSINAAPPPPAVSAWGSGKILNASVCIPIKIP